MAQCNVSEWSDVVQLIANDTVTIGLKVDGTVVATGWNAYQKLDVGSWSGITKVVSGNDNTFGIRTDGSVAAAGANYYGQLNVDDWTDIIQIAAGSNFTVGLKRDGRLIATGYCVSGQCDIDGWSDIEQISVGYGFTVGLKSDGGVVAVGSNTYGQCNVETWTDIREIVVAGYRTVGLKHDGSVVAVGKNDDGQCDVDDWTNITKIAAGTYHTVGLKSDGGVEATGRNDYGQCDGGDWEDIVQVATGGLFTVGLKNDGEVVFAGSNSCGQCDPMANLGQETGQIEGKIVDLASSSPIADATIHVGDSETHANSDGNYWIYVEPGSHDAEYSNAGYQSVIIPGITVDSDSPITMDIEMSAPGDLEIVTIQLSGANIGYAYNDRISIRGGIWPCTWSLDSGALTEGISLDVASGQLHGISNAEGTFSFTVRVTDSAANAVSRAYALDVVPVHTIAGIIAEGATIPVMLSGQQASDTITDDQGNFVFTQLENGTYQVTPNHPYYEFNPPSVAIVLDNQNATGVSFSFVENEPLCHTTTPQIAAGSLHALGLRACGSVLAVGDDDDGQLQVGDWSDIVQVAGGGYHSLGLKADGSVVSAGSNGDGQCNVGDWVNISKISAGESHSVAIKTDGTMVATGKND